MLIVESKSFEQWKNDVSRIMQTEMGQMFDPQDDDSVLQHAMQCYQQGLTTDEAAWELLYNPHA